MAVPEIHIDKRMLGVAGFETNLAAAAEPETFHTEQATRFTIMGGGALDHKIDIFPGIEVPAETKQTLQEKYGFDPAMEFLLQGVYDFLEARVVEDYFETDETARGPWEAEVFAKYGLIGKQILEDNKLRPNRFNDTISSVGMITDIVSAYAPASEAALRAAAAHIDSRATDFTDREYTAADGSTVTRPYPIYKTLTRPEKQTVIESITFASLEVINVLLNAEITAADAEPVTW